jgi:hypothetical protein
MKKEIVKVKMYSQEQAAKLGIENVPKDGVIFINTKNKQIIDFIEQL